MNILFLAPFIFPSVGGVQTHVLKVSEELVKRGHRITIISELPPKIKHNKKFIYQSSTSSVKQVLKPKRIDKSSYSYTLWNGKCNVYVLDYGKKRYSKKFKIWRTLFKYKELILSSDLVHCHDVYVWYFPMRLLFFWKKSYVTFHGYEGIVPPKKNAVLIRKISHELARESILVGSFIKKWYGTQSKYITYGGVERKKYFRYKHIKKTLRILIIGRLDRDIGVHTYIKVLNHLDELGIRYSCTVLGDGLMRTSIEKYATVKGFVHDISYMADHSDIIFASSYLSIMEGLMRKKLVVAVYENALKKDYLRPVSRYVLMGDDGSSLALEIQKYLKHKKQYKDMIELGNAWVLAQTWEKVADMYEEVWKK